MECHFSIVIIINKIPLSLWTYRPSFKLILFFSLLFKNLSRHFAIGFARPLNDTTFTFKKGNISIIDLKKIFSIRCYFWYFAIRISVFTMNFFGRLYVVKSKSFLNIVDYTNLIANLKNQPVLERIWYTLS